MAAAAEGESAAERRRSPERRCELVQALAREDGCGGRRAGMSSVEVREVLA